MIGAAVLEDLAPGDFVKLLPRERPHIDDPDLFWEVTWVNETSFDACCWVGGKVVARRRGVAFGSVTAWERRA